VGVQDSKEPLKDDLEGFFSMIQLS